MVDDNDIDNSVVDQELGWLVALQLLDGFRSLVDAAHERLAARGYPDARPAHGFALQAIGEGATATEVAARLGVTKQAAAKTLAALEQQGYVSRSPDQDDARRRRIVPSERGRALVADSAAAFDEVLDAWGEQIGTVELRRFLTSLGRLPMSGVRRLDLGAWSS